MFSDAEVKPSIEEINKMIKLGREIELAVATQDYSKYTKEQLEQLSNLLKQFED